MENTSLVDVALARKLFDDSRNSSTENGENEENAAHGRGQGAHGDSREHELAEFEKRFPLFADAEYVEGVLHAGECLYIPIGWWHFVESLEVSFNVSYWFN